MEEDMLALQQNDTWNLVTLSSAKSIVGYRWVYTMKYFLDRSIECLKACFVATGYTQNYSVNYSKAFSPIAKILCLDFNILY